MNIDKSKVKIPQPPPPPVEETRYTLSDLTYEEANAIRQALYVGYSMLPLQSQKDQVENIWEALYESMNGFKSSGNIHGKFKSGVDEF